MGELHGRWLYIILAIIGAFILVGMFASWLARKKNKRSIKIDEELGLLEPEPDDEYETEQAERFGIAPTIDQIMVNEDKDFTEIPLKPRTEQKSDLESPLKLNAVFREMYVELTDEIRKSHWCDISEWEIYLDKRDADNFRNLRNIRDLLEQGDLIMVTKEMIEMLGYFIKKMSN